MRVLVTPADVGGCGYYRLMFAAEHLRSLGHDVIIQYPNMNDGMEVMFRDHEIVDFKLEHDDVDVLVMQRVSHEWHTKVVPLIRSKGIAVVIDMDDDLSTIHPQNQAFHMYRHRNSNTPYSFKTAAQICKAATLVTVSTQTLLNVYARQGNGHVLDNYVPERYLYTYQPKDDVPAFGWGGTRQSHPVDLLACGNAIRDLVNMGHKFMIVGPSDPIITKQLKLKTDPPATGKCTVLEYPSNVSHLDVGIAPLEPSSFNTSKSRLKVLEYNSLGIPYVASPREQYRKYHRESNGGLLSNTPRDWVTNIDKLMKDENLRKELGEQGKSYAATQTIEKNSWRFLEAWTRAYEIQRGISK